jgi:peroxiredoxin
VFNERLGCANRTTFVIDADGIIRDIVASDSPAVVRESEHYVAALRALNGDS